MTAKEKIKAKQLVNGFIGYTQNYERAKQCALICVEEILIEKGDCHIYECYGSSLQYWIKVKEELKKL